MSGLTRTLVLVILGLPLLLGGFGVAEANGSPRRVVLTYLPEVSSWGPQGATGIAEVVMAEGEVRLTAVGLPTLDGEVYTAWLLNSKTNQALELGQFNSDAQSEARLQAVLPEAIPDAGWDLLLVTVEKSGEKLAGPGPRRAIAGFLTEPGQAAAPQQLPRTGGEAEQSEPPSQAPTDASPLLIAGAAAVAVGAGAWWAIARRRARPTGKAGPTGK